MSCWKTSASHAEQCAEKALKGVLVARSIRFPLTHSIGDWITLLQRAGLRLSNELLGAADLSVYAVITRYPGPAAVTDQDYEQALALAADILAWCEVQIAASNAECNSHVPPIAPKSDAAHPSTPEPPQPHAESFEERDTDSSA